MFVILQPCFLAWSGLWCYFSAKIGLGFAHRDMNNIWQMMWKFKPNMIEMEVCDTCRFFPFLSDKFYLTEIWIFEILRRSRYAPSRTYVAKYMFVFNTWVPIAPIFCTKTPIASSKPHPRNDFTNSKNMWFLGLSGMQ